MSAGDNPGDASVSKQELTSDDENKKESLIPSKSGKEIDATLTSKSNTNGIEGYCGTNLSEIESIEGNVIHDLYNSNGEFKDETLEQKYKKYVDKKTKKGLPVKNREKWKEAVDYWLVRSEQGKKFANEKFEEFKKENKGAQPEITILVFDPEKNETVKIRVDAIAYDEKQKCYKIQEYKSSENAPYTKNQLKGFEILYKYGGVVAGKGKEDDYGSILGKDEIPAGTDVEVVRPSGTQYYNKDIVKKKKMT